VKAKSLQWTASLVATVSMIIYAGCATPKPQKPSGGGGQAGGGGGVKAPSGYVHLDAGTGQPGLVRRSTKLKATVPTGSVQSFDVPVPSGAPDSSFNMTFKTYPAWVISSLGTYKFSYDPNVTNIFDTVDGSGNALYTGNKTYSMSSGSTTHIRYELNSNATIGQLYVIFGYGTGSSGTTYDAVYPFIPTSP